MDKTATQSIQLIENEMVINLLIGQTLSNSVGATSAVSVSQYKTNSEGVYFIYDKCFIVQNQLLNQNNEKKLFFVPYVHVAGMEIKLKTEPTVTADNQPGGEATGTVIKSEPAMG